jgi:Predicted metal-dependent hydrolase
MQLPPRIIEYIVVHELVHIKILDHSEKFWNALGSVMPDYENRKTWLKQKESEL